MELLLRTWRVGRARAKIFSCGGPGVRRMPGGDAPSGRRADSESERGGGAATGGGAGAEEGNPGTSEKVACGGDRSGRSKKTKRCSGDAVVGSEAGGSSRGTSRAGHKSDARATAKRRAGGKKVATAASAARGGTRKRSSERTSGSRSSAALGAARAKQQAAKRRAKAAEESIAESSASWLAAAREQPRPQQYCEVPYCQPQLHARQQQHGRAQQQERGIVSNPSTLGGDPGPGTADLSFDEVFAAFGGDEGGDLGLGSAEALRRSVDVGLQHGHSGNWAAVVDDALREEARPLALQHQREQCAAPCRQDVRHNVAPHALAAEIRQHDASRAAAVDLSALRDDGLDAVDQAMLESLVAGESNGDHQCADTGIVNQLREHAPGAAGTYHEEYYRNDSGQRRSERSLLLRGTPHGEPPAARAQTPFAPSSMPAMSHGAPSLPSTQAATPVAPQAEVRNESLRPAPLGHQALASPVTAPDTQPRMVWHNGSPAPLACCVEGSPVALPYHGASELMQPASLPGPLHDQHPLAASPQVAVVHRRASAPPGSLTIDRQVRVPARTPVGAIQAGAYYPGGVVTGKPVRVARSISLSTSPTMRSAPRSHQAPSSGGGPGPRLGHIVAGTTYFNRFANDPAAPQIRHSPHSVHSTPGDGGTPRGMTRHAAGTRQALVRTTSTPAAHVHHRQEADSATMMGTPKASDMRAIRAMDSTLDAVMGQPMVGKVSLACGVQSGLGSTPTSATPDDAPDGRMCVGGGPPQGLSSLPMLVSPTGRIISHWPASTPPPQRPRVCTVATGAPRIDCEWPAGPQQQ